MTSPQKRMTPLAAVCNLAGRPTVTPSMATMRELDPVERKGIQGREERKTRGGDFAFERNGGNYGGELRCNIREAGHAATARKRYGSQEGGCA